MAKRILIVEDDLIASMALEMILKDNGYEVIDRLTSADELTEICSSNQPDLILLDIMLDGNKTGLEAAEDLRKKILTPIIFLTALTNHETKTKINSLANSYILPKPYYDKDILSNIKKVL